jgi:hypothetical protein
MEESIPVLSKRGPKQLQLRTDAIRMMHLKRLPSDRQLRYKNRRLVFAFAFCAPAALSGCGGSQVQPAPSAPSQQSAAAAKVPAATRSWMAPAAKRDDLLYVSNLSPAEVSVYSYRGGELEGTLTGFGAPEGECTDKAGDVFISDARSEKVFEYAHGATSPLATFVDSRQSPGGCAVDRKTGTLAVASLGGDDDATGNVAIYAGGPSGKPTVYTDPSFVSFSKCTYDDQGNLFVDGTEMDGQFEFAELPAGGSELENVSLNQPPVIAGAVQWDGTYVTVEDQGVASEGSTIYQYTISGTTGTEVGSTTLGGSTDVIQTWIHGKTVVGPDASGKIFLWHYPSGGTAYKTITGTGEQTGAAVSLAPR